MGIVFNFTNGYSLFSFSGGNTPVVDPVITVSSASTISLVKNTYFANPPSTVNDPNNPNAQATVTSTLNSAVPGSYTITYSYTGATSVVITVSVVEGITVPPVRQFKVQG